MMFSHVIRLRTSFSIYRHPVSFHSALTEPASSRSSEDERDERPQYILLDEDSKVGDEKSLILTFQARQRRLLAIQSEMH